jgi:hypothetical protein
MPANHQNHTPHGSIGPRQRGAAGAGRLDVIAKPGAEAVDA